MVESHALTFEKEAILVNGCLPPTGVMAGLHKARSATTLGIKALLPATLTLRKKTTRGVTACLPSKKKVIKIGAVVLDM